MEDDDLQGYGFKGTRAIDYSRSLHAVLTSVTEEQLDEAHKDCDICTLRYDYEGHRPVRLACGHVFADECIRLLLTDRRPVEDLQTTQPSDITCPYRCVGSPFSAEVVRSLEFGLCRGVFSPDMRYTDFENFERACADLDSQVRPHEAEDSFIRVKAPVMKETLKTLYKGARMKIPASTPYHLQPVRFPETQIAGEAISSFLDQLDGSRMSLPELNRKLEYAISEELHKHMNTRVYRQFLSKEAGAVFKPASWELVGLPLRPGFYHWMRRVISRMIWFQKCRPCNCMGPGYHCHGSRVYYNARNTELTHPLGELPNLVEEAF